MAAPATAASRSWYDDDAKIRLQARLNAAVRMSDPSQVSMALLSGAQANADVLREAVRVAANEPSDPRYVRALDVVKHLLEARVRPGEGLLGLAVDSCRMRLV